MVFFTRATGDSDAVHAARGDYVVWFEEDDHARLLLKQAQPELQWHKPLPAAPDSEGLAYGDFAEIVLVGASNGEDDKKGYPLMQYILGDQGLG
jgi:hypothetical protein